MTGLAVFFLSLALDVKDGWGRTACIIAFVIVVPYLKKNDSDG
jgi:hypothetical protein